MHGDISISTSDLLLRSGEARGKGETEDSRVPTSIGQIVDGRLHLGLCLLLLQEGSELSLFLPNMNANPSD